MTDLEVDYATLAAAHQTLYRIATELERAEARRELETAWGGSVHLDPVAAQRRSSARDVLIRERCVALVGLTFVGLTFVGSWVAFCLTYWVILLVCVLTSCGLFYRWRTR